MQLPVPKNTILPFTTNQFSRIKFAVFSTNHQWKPRKYKKKNVPMKRRRRKEENLQETEGSPAKISNIIHKRKKLTQYGVEMKSNSIPCHPKVLTLGCPPSSNYWWLHCMLHYSLERPATNVVVTWPKNSNFQVFTNSNRKKELKIKNQNNSTRPAHPHVLRKHLHIAKFLQDSMKQWIWPRPWE